MESTITADNPVLAEVVRSGFAESVHRGPVIGLGADGEPVLAEGAVREPIFPRSSNKPLQAAAMVRCGLDLDGKLLALAAASHSGEDFHVAGAREILAGAGLTERRAAVPARPADGRAEPACPDPAGRTARPSAHELLGQARGHAGHLRGGGLADRQLPGSGAPAAG